MRRSPSNRPWSGSGFHGGIARLRVDLGDAPGARAHIFIGQQAEGGRLSRAMTGGAVLEQNRRDVTGKREPFLC